MADTTPPPVVVEAKPKRKSKAKPPSKLVAEAQDRQALKQKASQSLRPDLRTSDSPISAQRTPSPAIAVSPPSPKRDEGFNTATDDVPAASEAIDLDDFDMLGHGGGPLESESDTSFNLSVEASDDEPEHSTGWTTMISDKMDTEEAEEAGKDCKQTQEDKQGDGVLQLGNEEEFAEFMKWKASQKNAEKQALAKDKRAKTAALKKVGTISETLHDADFRCRKRR